MLEEPRPHDVRGDLGKDSSLLLLPRQTRLGVVVHQAVPRPDTVVQAVTCISSSVQN